MRSMCKIVNEIELHSLHTHTHIIHIHLIEKALFFWSSLIRPLPLEGEEKSRPQFGHPMTNNIVAVKPASTLLYLNQAYIPTRSFNQLLDESKVPSCWTWIQPIEFEFLLERIFSDQVLQHFH